MSHKKHSSNFMKNQMGYTMVTTLIAIAFVTILGVIVLSASSMNLRMKYIDKKTKKNFYVGELSLDDLYNGIGLKVSECYGIAYSEILRNASDGTQAKHKTQEEAYADFRTVLCTQLNKTFASGTDISSLFFGYMTVNSTITGSAPDQAIVSGHGPGGQVDTEVIIDANGDPVQFVFKDVTITYQLNDGTGYESSITTDIVIDFPYVAFFDEHDNLLDYAVAANRGLYINGDRASITGNVYAGAGVTPKTGYDEKITNATLGQGIFGGINIKNAAVTINGKYILSKADINVRNGSTLTINGVAGAADEANVWAETIRTTESGATHSTGTTATISLFGNTFLSNDLELNSYYSNVRLSGAFYGFNNLTYMTKENELLGGTSAPKNTKSSAIIVNGKNSNLDLSNLSTLMVAGRAYVDLAGKDDGTGNKEYATGESLAVKTNQIIYFAPDRYLGCVNPSKVSSFSASLTAQQVGDLVTIRDTDGKYAAEWFGIINGYVNKTHPIIAEKVTRNGVAYYYFYLNLVTEDGIDHSGDYVKYILNAVDGSSDNLIAQAYELKLKMKERMFTDAIDTITFKDDTTSCRIYGQGALQKTVGSGSTGIMSPILDTSTGGLYKGALSLDVVAEASVKLNKRYEWLYTMLDPKEEYPLSAAIPNILDTDYLSNIHKNADGSLYQSNDAKHSVYLPLSNYIDFYQIDTNNKNINNGATRVNGKPVIVDADVADCIISSNYQGIILCRGNVVIQNGAIVKGIVLATGTITLENGATIISDRGVAQKVLEEELKQTDATTNTNYASYYFVNYKPVDSNMANSYTTSTNYIDWITYKNWRKGDE